ncbi:hypothetical protein AURANDRAFT_68454 [Aureococcus anophagefferens]|uniref:Uncharacterized protein n=1 Tax=Aureococcus anophagefferens TaxID=44056 RepID=F0YPP7_AURAN|nr:hypothetical protein AURANDRAFT_68454 [Aureococcus anophagefferens]EGB02914.1 hypothetical protein AURANDRAFT_68454 [Aureococcus anophagefferens]|eukprot:XP_009042388.1 hypothetical protein AURANDRAFT_68454 [Aureococcus anophagefferens]
MIGFERFLVPLVLVNCQESNNCYKYVITLEDEAGDGWFGNSYHIKDDSGLVVASGTLNFEQAYEQERACLQNGCHSFSIVGNPYGGRDEIAWSLGEVKTPSVVVLLDPYSTTELLLVDGRILDGLCSPAPSVSSSPTLCPTSTGGPTATSSPTSTYCYEIVLLSPLSIGWQRNRLVITPLTSDATSLTLDLEQGSYDSKTICLANGCYLFDFGGSGRIGTAIFVFVFDDQFSGIYPESNCLEFGELGCDCDDPLDAEEILLILHYPCALHTLHHNSGSYLLGSWLIAKRTLIVLSHTRVLTTIIAVFYVTDLIKEYTNGVDYVSLGWSY